VSPSRLQLKACSVDLGRGEVLRADGRTSLWLTELEGRLLRYLVARRGEVVSRDQLHQDVWGYAEGLATRAADFTVSRLRAKIELNPGRPHHLKTVRGEGYRFDLDDGAVAEPSGPAPDRPVTTAVSLAGVTVDLTGRRLLKEGRQVDLTTIESALLEHLARRLGQTVSRGDLMRAIWNDKARAEHELDHAVERIRTKLEDDPTSPRRLIATADGLRLEPPDGEPVEIPRTNLRPERSRFVGRAGALADLWEMLARPGRVVTVVGPAGCGKTRLAMHFAALELAEDRWPGGVWAVDLSGARTIAEGLAAVASELGVPGDPTDADKLSRRLVAGLQSRGRVMLVLDTLEQAAGPLSAMIRELLDVCAELRVLATSRERLGLEGETLLDLGPLPLPEAVELFLARAEDLRRDWAAGPADRDLVEQLVQRLDRLPLAIELAAGHARTLGPLPLLKRLEGGLGLPGGRRRDGPARHATLEAAIRWSWEQLDDNEREALLRLTAFASDFTLEAAEGVLDLPTAAVDLVAALCDRSLLRSREAGDHPGALRFSPWEQVRTFAAQRLQAAPFRDDAHRRVRTWLMAWGEERAAELEGLQGVSAQRGLRAELDNVVAAMREAASSDGPANAEPTDAARLALLAAAGLQSDGSASLTREVLDVGVCAAADADDQPLLARALATRGGRMRVRGRVDESEADLLRAAELAREIGDAEVEAEARLQLAALFRRRMEMQRYEGELDLVMDLAADLSSPLLEARAHTIRGLGLAHTGALMEATHEHRLALGGILTAGCILREVQGRLNLGARYRDAGRYEEAEEQLRFAMEVVESTGDAPNGVLSALGQLELGRGRLEEAEHHLERCLAMEQEQGLQSEEAWTRVNLAALYLEQGRTAGVAELLSRALSLHLSNSGPEGVVATHANLGILALIEGRANEARAELQEAAKVSADAGARRMELLVRGYLSIARGALGGGQLRKAKARAKDGDPTSDAWFLELCDAMLDLARGDEEPAAATLARAEAAGPLDSDARIVRGLLRTELQRANPDGD